MGSTSLRAISIAVAVVVGMSGSAFAEKTLRLSHTASPTSARQAASVEFAKLVNEYTEGRYKVQVFPSAQLANDPKGVEQLALGALDFLSTGPASYGAYDRNVYALGLPYLVQTYEQGWKLYDESEFIKNQKKALIEKGIRIIGNWEAGFRSVTATFPINSVEDVKGKKIRVPPEEALLWTMEAQGWTPIQLPFPEVYLALQQGLVTAQENPVDTFYSARFYEVAKYIVMTRHTYSPQWLAISEKSWGKLSAKDQEAIMRAGKESSTFIRQLVKNSEEDALKDMESKGAVITWPDLTPWVDAVKPVYQKAREKYDTAGVDLLLEESKKIVETTK